MMQTGDRILFISMVIHTTQKQGQPVEEAKRWDLSSMSWLCHNMLPAFKDGIALLMVPVSHVQFNKEVNKGMTHKKQTSYW